MRRSSAAWVALSLCKHLGGKTFRALLRHFDHDLEAILHADTESLRQVRGIGPKIAQAIRAADVVTTAHAMTRWEQAGVRILTWDDADYPDSLKAIDDAPPTLFVRGDIPSVPRWVAVVGTRSPSPESRELAGQIGATLDDAGLVSGLAAGIDAAAHIGALAAPGTPQIAVLGSGVLNIYPPEHRALAEAVMQQGALVCEVAPDAPVSSPGLVARNRIITALCSALIVVETETDGGAMHAARFAKLQGKPVYAVDNAASGNRQLLAEGAEPLILPERP